MKRALAFVPLAALVCLIALAAFMLSRGGERELFSSGLIGRQVPAFELQRLDGGAPISNADLAGRAHVVNLFASWCAPCRVEHPLLMQLRADGVPIVGVAYKDAPGAAAQFLNELGDPYAVVALDPEGRFGLDLGIAGVPETFVVGADGTVRAVHRGPLTEDVIRGEILPALDAR